MMETISFIPLYSLKIILELEQYLLLSPETVSGTLFVMAPVDMFKMGFR